MIVYVRAVTVRSRTAPIMRTRSAPDPRGKLSPGIPETDLNHHGVLCQIAGEKIINRPLITAIAKSKRSMRTNAIHPKYMTSRYLP